MSLSFPQKAPDLETDLVKLCQLDESVLENYLDLLSDSEVIRLTATTENYSPNQILNWLQSRSSTPERLDWAIHSLDTGVFLGEIVLNELNREENSMNLRIALLTKHTSRGLGSQALKLVCDYGLCELGLSRITLEVLASNLRAISAYQKVGFERDLEYFEAGNHFIQMVLKSS